jgi:4-hydroxy-3-methylbut-2-enyl diphosphate reductase
VAETHGTRAHLINDVRDIRPEWLEGIDRVGVTAGASTPEFLVREVVDYLSARKPGVREFHVVDEDVRFGLPHELLELARAAGKPLASGAPTSS